MSSRAAALLIAGVIALGGATGGTLAWIFSESAPVQNTFNPAGIDVSVEETPTDDGDDDPNTNSYTMLPGATIGKDPIVTFAAGGEDAWLFVQMDESANFRSFLDYAMADGWTALEGADGVYWRTADKSEQDQTFGVIADNAVMVKPEVTAAMLNTLTPETAPTLTVTAFAIQRTGVEDAQLAYALAQEQSETP